MRKRMLALAICLLTVVSMTVITGVTAWAAPADYYTGPAQIAVAMTEDPQHSVVITWTTIDTTLTDATVTVTAGSVDKTFNAVKTVRSVSSSNLRTAANAAVSQKAFYVANVTGLAPNTTYSYVCSAVDADSAVYAGEAHTFKTAPAANDTFTFIYLSDTQASGANGKAITTTTSVFTEKYPNASFIYIAGDLTDTAANEGQWEMFFNQKANSYANASYVNNVYENYMSDYVIAAVQGNHDNNTFANHLNYPASGGTNLTYAYTYGSARFIMLNFENTTTRAQQEAFLRAEVTSAKAAGLWTIVGFHKSIYSGASHMNDSDVISARQYWSPIFAELDVDAVLQGHDHVLSRGFVNELGENKGSTQKVGNRTYTATNPTGAPLYYVGNCASTLKFYATANYTASATNRVTANYEFLDLNSARAAGHAQNPDGPQTSDTYQGPTFVAVTVSQKSITFDTYMYQRNSSTDVITTQPFLYDSFTVSRVVPNLNVAAISVPAQSARGQNVDFTVSLGDVSKVTGAVVTFTVDATKLQGADSVVTGLNGFTAVTDVTWTQLGSYEWQGKVTLSYTGGGAFSTETDKDICKVTYTAIENGNAWMDLKSVALTAWNNQNQMTRVDASILNERASTNVSVVYSKYDLNRDGIVDELDLGIAAYFYMWNSDSAGWNAPSEFKDANGEWIVPSSADVNGDGEVSLADLLEIILNYTA